MPVKIYEPIKSSDVKAIRWFGDNWDEVKKFLGDKLINEDFLFTHPLTEKKKEMLASYHSRNICDSEGRLSVLFKTGYTKESSDYLYYGDWLYCRYKNEIKEPYLHCCSDVFLNAHIKKRNNQMDNKYNKDYSKGIKDVINYVTKNFITTCGNCTDIDCLDCLVENLKIKYRDYLKED